MSQAMDDSALLDALAEGDLDALGCLYDQYARGIFHVLLARGLGKDAAEDAVQDVFLALLDRGKAARRIGNVRAYLITVARNMASRHLRRRRKFTELEPVELVTEERTSAQVAHTVAVRQALEQLPPEQTEVVALKVWGELTFAEIGEVLEIPQNTAASRYRYALEKLRGIWIQEDLGGDRR